MGEITPPLVVPHDGKYIWDWFGAINNAVSRIEDGFCKPIPPSEYIAWISLSGLLVTPTEYGILQAMDAIYCEEVNKELRSARSKREDEQRRQAEEARSKQRSRRR